MDFKRIFSVTTIALIISANSVFAQVKRKPVQLSSKKPNSTDNNASAKLLPTDPNVIIGKLPNGLTYYIRKNILPKNRAELYLINKAGSILETDDQRGLAHFTEHMAFNGTRDFPKNELVSYLQKSGVKFGADLNAYTSFDETVYQLPLPTDSVKLFERGFDILVNWAGLLTFDPKEIDSERGVVLEEARLRGKNAQERMQQQTLPVLLNNSRYAQRLPIGQEDILKNFKPETIKSFFHDWYRPDLQAVIAVGDFDVKRVEQLIRTKFSGLKNPANEKLRVKYTVPAATGTVVKIVTDKEFPYTVAQVVVKHPEGNFHTEADFMRSIRISMFNQMINARLSELLQKPTPPFLFAQASYAGFFGGMSAFSTVVVAKSTDQLQTAIKTALDEVERARKFGFTQTELDRAKQNLLTGMENTFKEKDKTKSAVFVGQYQQNFLRGGAIPGIEFEYNFYKNNIGAIKLAEINALADKFISDQNRVVVVNAPDKEKANLPTEQTLLNWVNATGKDITAYVDNVSSKPLLAKEPVPGKVISETKDAAIGVTTLTLSNGVKLFLKPTDFKNDQILIYGYHFGGTSLADDKDFDSAGFASDLAGSSGIADMTQIQLGKMLSGKNVWMTPFISEITQGVSGGSSPKDFETALQLMYLYFTQPRKDMDIWQSKISQIKALLPNRSLDPQSAFLDTVFAVLGDHNYRRMPFTLQRLNNASLDKAYDFYKERFADARGFTFSLVGSFDIEKIKPLLEKYFGGLPAAGHSETYKNLNIHPPAGQFTKTVYKGIGDKSSVRIVFSGDYEYNDTNNQQLGALEEVMNIKLLERLREKESGVYSPGIDIGHSKLPGGRYHITIYFTCAPANVDKLINATMDEINKIRQNGPQLVDIQKFQAEEKRSAEVYLKQNDFWSSVLLTYAQNDENPDIILQHIPNLQNLTVQNVKETANKYLNDANLIKLVLYPDKK